jgi:hypothetical protein
MPRPRLPAAKAAVTGAALRHPERHRNRKEPASTSLGKPSIHLDDFGKRAFEAFKRELPWLTEGDRALVEVAASLRGRLIEDAAGVGVSALQALSAVLSKLGATPTDRSKVSAPADEEEPDEFFGVN